MGPIGSFGSASGLAVDWVATLQLTAGVLGLVATIGALIYAVWVTKHTQKTAYLQFMGAESCPRIDFVLSDNGYNVLLMSDANFPHYGIWVRIHDFAVDKIIDPTKIGPNVLSDPMVSAPDLYPGRINLNPLFEINLSNGARARINLFVHTRNAQSTVELVAINADGEKKIAYKESLPGGDCQVQIPDDFPVENPDDPNSLFSEDEPTGRLFTKVGDQLIPFPDGHDE